MSLETWLAFFAACWVISLSPGAGAIASMSCGLQYGFWRGYWNALGLQLGLALQIAIVAAGVGAILAASSTAFYAIKWFGVAYLVYLAVKQWRALPADLSDDAAVRPIGKPLALVFRGFLVNVSNPKALVFMLAVLPQFVNPAAPLVSQYLTLGVTHDLRRPDRHGRLHRVGVQGPASAAYAATTAPDEPHLCRSVCWRGGFSGDVASRYKLKSVQKAHKSYARPGVVARYRSF